MLRGHVDADFVPVARELERQIERRGGGAAVCVYHEGACVADLWGGVRDETGAPWEQDTMCVSYSTTKGVVSTGLHVLVDRDLVDYDDRVADHWPEFGQAGKSSITIRDVLAHRAGLFNIRDRIEDARQLLDWDFMTSALAEAPAEPVPAGATAYQALTYGFLIGEIIQRVSGKSLPDFLHDAIAAPLGLDGLYVGAPAEQLHRAARLIGTTARDPDRRAATRNGRARRRRQLFWGTLERALRAVGHPVDFERAAAALAPKGISTLDFSSDEVLQASIPAANGLFTARSLARLYAALANGGELDGARILSPETIARATEIQSDGYDQITLFKMRWRLGYHRVASLRGVPQRAFGHFGWGGSGAWADPTRNLSMAFVTNVGTGSPLGDLRILRLNTRVLTCTRVRHHRNTSRPAPA